MKVNFDGLRRSIAETTLHLKHQIEVAYDQDLNDAFDDMVQHINNLLCIYDDDIEGDFNELSDHLISYIEDAEE